MGWNYSGNPASSQTDRVRFYIGDTDPTDPILQDEEITFLLSEEGSPLKAAQGACRAIIAKYAREVDYTIGPERVAASELVAHYQGVLKTLIEKSKASGAPSYGSSRSESTFDVGMHDASGGGNGLDA
jgi:hypothetical protein